MSRTMIALASAALAVVALVWAQARSGDVLLYNHSPSLPVGFYLRDDGEISRHAIVTIRARDAAPRDAAQRGFDGADDRFLKRVAAVDGDLVCSAGAHILINGRVSALRRSRDVAGRALPSWSGCRRLGANDLFLLGDAPDSFDGRYWGVSTRAQIDGVWRTLP